MTKGVGVNTEMFGETSGDLVKPGMTRRDMDEIERRGIPDGPDPFGDVFKEGSHSYGASQGGRAPLPEQDDHFASGHRRDHRPSQPQSGGQKRGGFKIILCTFFEQNKCQKGSSCTYAHGPHELK